MEETFNLSLTGLNFFQLTMQIISGLLFIFSLAISLRIIMSWVKLGHTSKFAEVLGKVVDPYLNIFRGLPWLRVGALDFSPILGIVLVSFVLSITSRLASTGYISGWEILILIIASLWQIVSFFLTFLIIIFVVRLITSQIQSLKNHPILTSFDSMIYSISSGVIGLFASKPVSFVTATAITLVVLLVIRITGTIGINILLAFLRGLTLHVGG